MENLFTVTIKSKTGWMSTQILKLNCHTVESAKEMLEGDWGINRVTSISKH